MPAGLPPRRSRRWIGFFVVLAVLGVAAMVVPLVYNLSLQLHSGQLADARRRWLEKRPADYDLECLLKTEEGGVAAREQRYFVQVRGGRVVAVVDEGEVVYLDPAVAVIAGMGARAISSAPPARYDVAALFDRMEAAMRQDEQTGQRNFTTAQFDAGDGHPTYFRRSVRETKVHLEWFVKLSEPRP